MIEKSVVFASPSGLHARPASKLSEMVRTFPGDVLLIHEEKTADMKSIINLIAMGIKKGTRITIQADGKGEEELIDRIADYITNLID